MKKTTLLLLLILSILGVQAQTIGNMPYDSIKVGRSTGLSGTNLWGRVYLPHTPVGSDSDSILTILNKRVRKVATLPISKVTGLQDSLTAKANLAGGNTFTGAQHVLDSLLLGPSFGTPGNFRLRVSTPLGMSPVSLERKITPGTGLARAVSYQWVSANGGIMQVNDGLGQIYAGSDSAGTQTTYASLEAPVKSVATNKMLGRLQMWFADGTDLKANPLYLADHIPYANFYPRYRDTSSPYMFYGTENGGGGSIRGNAIGVGDSSVLFLDKLYRVGINNVNPAEALDVTGNGKFSGNLLVNGSLTAKNGTFNNLNNTATQVIGGANTDESFGLLVAAGTSASDYALRVRSQDGGTTFFNINGVGDVSFSNDVTVSDEAYSSFWNGSLEVPTKNAVYDKIESLAASGTSVLKDWYTDSGNSGSTQTDLYSYTIPANTLTTDGQKLRFRLSGSYAGNSNNKAFTVSFGSVNLSLASAVFNGGQWRITGMITRTSSSTCRISVDQINLAGSGTTVNYVAGTGLDYTATNLFALKGTGVATNDIVANVGTLEFLPAAP